MNIQAVASRKAHGSTDIQKETGAKVSVSKPEPTLSAETKARKSYASLIDCSKPISVDEINYEMVSNLIDSWDRKILNIPDWSRVTGISFLRHIFRIAPSTVTIFGYPEGTKWDDPALSEDDKFVQKGIRLIRAIDMAVAFLGPDLDPLEHQLYQLGWQHIAMKALPSHWPIVGDALLAVFEDCMIGGFKEKERDAWIKIYSFMGYHMIQGLTAHYKKRGESWKIKQDQKGAGDSSEKQAVARQLARSSSYRKELQCTKHVPASSISFNMVNDVTNSWKEITSIPNWEKVAGDLFLRYIFKIEPGTIQLFGFPDDTGYMDPELTKNVKFVTKGVVLIKAIDTAVQLLGPDVFPLEEVLYDLGKRHVIMKAQPEFWPLVGEALFLVFEELMGNVFAGDVRTSWTVMYNFLGYHMIQGLKYQYKEIEKKHKRRMTA